MPGLIAFNCAGKVERAERHLREHKPTHFAVQETHREDAYVHKGYTRLASTPGRTRTEGTAIYIADTYMGSAT